MGSDLNDAAAIIFWVSLGTLVLGIILTILFGILFAVARSKPVAPSPPGYPPASRGGGCMLVAAILSFVFLVLGPAIGMAAAAVIEAARPPARTYGSPSSNSSASRNASASTRDLETTADRIVSEATTSANDAELEARVAALVATMRGNLPQRNGPATLYNVQANGTQLILFVRLSQDFGGPEWLGFDQGVRSETCGGPFATIVRGGGSLTYRVQDSGDEPHEVTISSCR